MTKTAISSGHLIHIAKFGLLRFGLFVELRTPTRSRISCPELMAKTAISSGHLIHIAKFGLLRSGLFVELRSPTRRDVSRDAAWA